jgi:hypothetical protein
MTLELIIFIATTLFGIVCYWRESQSNKRYRLFHKLMNSKELQMKSTDKKGFIFQQSFLLRVVFISSFFLVIILIVRFLIPIDLATISLFTSMILGTLIGTYIAGFIFKSSEIIVEKTDSLEDSFHEVIEKGKDFIDDLQGKDAVNIDSENEKEKSTVPQKSARERLKEKGLL